jgi:hypothetical protein
MKIHFVGESLGKYSKSMCLQNIHTTVEMVRRDKVHGFLFDVSMKQKRESGKIFFIITAQSNKDKIVFR